VSDEPRSDEEAGREARERLTSGRLLVRNSALTFVSRILMIGAAVVAVPLLLDQLGTARFGVLTLAWVVIGYASVFDLGLGRALTKLTAEKLGQGREREVPALFWTATALLGFMGCIAAVLVAAATPVLVADVLDIPAGLEGETRAAFFLLAVSIPFVLLSAALRGSLEARQRFDLSNSVAVGLSVLSYFGPVALSVLTQNLAVAVSAVVASRVAGTAINLWMCLRVDPALRAERRIDRGVIGPMLRYGGWITATALIAPLLVTMDRFFIGALLDVEAVAYYATPFEAVRQLLVVAVSLSVVLFPAYSATVSTDRARAEQLFDRGSRAIFTALFPLALTVVAFAPEILGVWVGAEFERNSTDVMRWLAAGVLLNGLTFVAFGLLQSTRPDLITKLLLVELVIYVPIFYVMVQAFGVEGAAIAATVRVGLDMALQHVVLHRLGLLSTARLRAAALRPPLAVVCFALIVQLDGLAARAAAEAVILAVFAVIAWRHLFEDDERRGIAEMGRRAAGAMSLRRHRTTARTGA
jgi:O-antigen/teichoic acid export membrane protein